jgi:hypothetical protein
MTESRCADLLLTPEEIYAEFRERCEGQQLQTNHSRIRGSNESLVSDA